jgi:hypothetical protein
MGLSCGRSSLSWAMLELPRQKICTPPNKGGVFASSQPKAKARGIFSVSRCDTIYDTILSAMNSSQQKTLEQIFTVPVRKNIAWRDIESLFIALGCEVIEGNGSRVAFRFDQLRADFHRPHPNKEAKPYQVRDAKEFLTALGFIPPEKISTNKEEHP